MTVIGSALELLKPGEKGLFISTDGRNLGLPGKREGKQRSLEQDGETLLREMIIMRQDVGDAFLSHGFHRDAVGEAVILVEAGFVECEAVEERLVGLRGYRDVGIGQDPLCIADGSLAYHSPLTAEMGKEFGQDFFRSNDRRPA